MKSGKFYSTHVTFIANETTSQRFHFFIINDDVAFENVERHLLSFTSSIPPVGPALNLGQNAEVTITDDDGWLLIT